jgi:hypothetical protein
MSKEYFQDSCALLESDVNNKALGELKKIDRGLNTVTRRVLRHDGVIKNKEINVFTSNGTGFKIRDAETGDYTPYTVGSKDEDLFFKISLSTGELKSHNGSNTLFYESPHHYMNHLFANIRPDIIAAWENKKNERMLSAKLEKKSDIRGVEVR